VTDHTVKRLEKPVGPPSDDRDSAEPEPVGSPNLITNPFTADSDHLGRPLSIFGSGTMSELPPGAIRLSEVTPTKVDWLSKGRLARGKVTTFEGDPGYGKSTLALDWAARITTGRELPDGTASQPRGVVLLQGEDGWDDTVVPRLAAAGADMDGIVGLGERPDGTFPSIPDDIPLIEQTVTAIDAALVIIDPLMAFLNPRIDAHRDQDVRRALRPLGAMAERLGVAVILVRHLNKAIGRSPLHRGGGSIGIIGAARFGLLVAPDPEDPEVRVVAQLKGNLGKAAPALAFKLVDDTGNGVARVAYVGTSRHNAESLLAVHPEGSPATKIAESQEWLKDLLADGPLLATRVKEEAEQAGIAHITLRRASKLLGITPRKSDFNSGPWEWSLPTASSGADEGDHQGGR
jgi:hypothetical protein